MNYRIRKIYEASGKNQTDFSESIGISRAALQKLMTGENNPRENTIREICRVYSISRTWLETGEGPMHLVEDQADEYIDKMLAGDDEFGKALLRTIARMPVEDLRAIERMFESLKAALEKPTDDQ